MESSPRLIAEHLTEIRQNTDWRQLFEALQLTKDPKKSKDHDWWAKSPFLPDERTASFHMNARGWYCHATGQGGGPIELVQRLHPGMHCFDAGRWLLDHGVSRIVADAREDLVRLEEDGGSSKAEVPAENQPVRQDLRSQLSASHRLCAARGVPPEVYRELGAGYLDRTPRRNGHHDPLNHRIVFQIRGIRENESAGRHEPVILGHMGRATTEEQAERDGKWWTYAGFRKSLELYNLDQVILEEQASDQAKDTGHVLVVEGPFDVARLYAAGIRNVVATLGTSLSSAQIRRLHLIGETTGVSRFLFFYDRDRAGRAGAEKALQAIAASGLELQAESFNWDQTWESPYRGEVGIPASVIGPSEFSLGQLQWLRHEGLI